MHGSAIKSGAGLTMTRRTFLGSGVVSLTCGITNPSFAQTRATVGQHGQQVAAVYRTKIGEIEVSALLDGYLDLELSLLAEADPKDAARLLQRSFVQTGPYRASVNAYVINTGERLLLVDTGGGTSFAPTLGWLPRHLKAGGIDPADVDAVLLTHIHPDHSNGLLDANGGKAFPNADVFVSAAEYDFWTDAAHAAVAPAAMKPFFETAKTVVRPYGSRLHRVDAEEFGVRDVRRLPAAGHTPGHCAYAISSGSEQLLIWGDVVHIGPLQFARPDWTIAFDVDQPKAAETRKRLLEMASADRLLIAGMHLPFPGFGHVDRAVEGFAFVPAPWEPVL
jgi:glyoxylase-like metal-dependent hydrolase (beta-lactamase superfamily II)